MVKLLILLLLTSTYSYSKELLNYSDYLFFEKTELKVGDFEIEKSNIYWRILDRIESDAIGKSANFAGKYYLLQFGCGTECIGLRLIDLENGNILKTNIPSSAGDEYCFNKNSRLILVNTITENNERSTSADKDRYHKIAYEWINNKFSKLDEYNDLVVDSCDKI